MYLIGNGLAKRTWRSWLAASILINAASIQDVEECIADVFIYLWQYPEKYDPDKAKLSSWLSVIARTKAIDRYRRNIGKRELPKMIVTTWVLPTLSAYKNLDYLASLRGVIGKKEIRNAITTAGLDPDDKKHVGKYSLGMKQRLGIAQAIMENPDILILDEPMNALDKNGVAEIRNYCCA